MKAQTLLLNKLVGETPLQCIQRYQESHPEYADVKLGYAGRLDPMAEGLLLVLVGDANKNKYRPRYLGMDKTYEVDILFGVSTDSHDVLGVIQDMGAYEYIDEKKFEQVLQSYKGTFEQQYPIFSSKTVEGKPLYKWAHEGRIDEIEIPKEKRTIYSVKLLKQYDMTKAELHESIKEKIGTLSSGKFRSEEVLKSWEMFFVRNPQGRYTINRVQITCSTGTYMRSLAHDIGKKMGVPAIAYHIRRTNVGKHSLDNAVNDK